MDQSFTIASQDMSAAMNAVPLEGSSAIHLAGIVQTNGQGLTNGQKRTFPRTITAVRVKSGALNCAREFEIKFQDEVIIGNGSFGCVNRAQLCSSGEYVAIKKVRLDNRFKNRELDIMKEMSHPNIVKLIYYHIFEDENKVSYARYFMEYIPGTLNYWIKNQFKIMGSMYTIHVRLFSFQLLRAVGYMHLHGIVHRDIKPHNILVDFEKGILKVCDLGSAKKIGKGDVSIAYICSRYYRAPELILGATNYNETVDLWSIGCVIAEMYTNLPLFLADNAVDLLVAFIKVLGTPEQETKEKMFEKIGKDEIRDITGIGLKKKIGGKISSQSLRLIESLLKYEPTERISAIEALTFNFFDELRKPDILMPNGRPIPPIFEWYEKELAGHPHLNKQIFPQRKASTQSVELPPLTIAN